MESSLTIVTNDPVFKSLKTEIKKLIEYANKAEITDDDTCVMVTDDLSMMRKLNKALTESRVAYVKPLNNEVAAINQLYKDIAGPLAIADRSLESKMIDWQRAERLRIEKERADALLAQIQNERVVVEATGEIIEAEVEAPAVPDMPDRIQRGQVGTASLKQVPKYAIVKPKLVPAKYWIIDEKKVAREVKAGVDEIPGIVIWMESGLNVR